MNKQEALDLFYAHNRIDPDLLQKGFYQDPRLTGLPDNIDLWMRSIQAQDHELFLRLLSGYTYITNFTAVQRFEEAVSLLDRDHLSKQSIPMANVAFITVEAADELKGGSDHVRSDLHRPCMDKIDAGQIVASARKLEPKYFDDKLAFVFVDDIVSTGFTLWKTIKEFLGRFPQAADHPLYYMCIVPTSSGIRHLKSHCAKEAWAVAPVYKKEWRSLSAFKRSLFPPHESKQVEAKIREYEEWIDGFMKDSGKSYVMGFRESKQLLSFYYNTPNNSLCCFWRQTDQHHPLFKRQKQPAPTLRELQAVKKRKDNSAYQITKERRERKRNERSGSPG